MLILIFISLVPFHSAKTVGVDFECPLLFNEGENILTCRINTTAVKEAHCSSMYSDVMFEWIANSGKGVGCQSAYNPQQKCTSGEQHKPGSCWCEDSPGEIITYKFSYQANSTSDKGRQFECNLCVLPQKPLGISSSEGCANISFADSKADIGVQSPKTGLITGIVIGLEVILLIILSIIMMKKFQCSYFHREKRKADIELKHPMNPILEEEKKSNRPEQNGHSSVLIINDT